MVLTAAHCVTHDAYLEEDKSKNSAGVNPSDINVYLGLHARVDYKRLTPRKVKRVLFHPGWLRNTGGRNEYDIALIELIEHVKFNEIIKPICIPRTEDLSLRLIDRSAWVTGWGYYIDPDLKIFPDVLQKLELPIREISFCNSIIPDAEKANGKLLVCAGTLNKLKDAAQGDSGGPLSIEIGLKQQFLQVGVVSYGYDNERDDTASLFTSVGAFLSFVDYYSYQAEAKWCPLKHESKNSTTNSGNY